MMDSRDKENLEAMDKQIENIVLAAEELKRLSNGIPAVDKNADAILAFAHILQTNVSDVVKASS